MAGDRLLLLEHPPVVTIGRSGKPDNLLATPAELAARGVEVHEIARGGDVTYHAPGQLVGYPIVDLDARGERDVHRFLRAIEESLIEVLGRFGLRGARRDGMTGVFLQLAPAPREAGVARRPRKIASIGIGVRHWISYHGFALNVSLDLSGFDAIVPCGLDEVEMTSIAVELERAGEPVPADLDLRVRDAVSAAFARRWGE